MTTRAGHDDLTDALRPQVDSTESRISDLRERISELTGDTRARFEPFIAALDRAGRAVKTVLRDLAAATGDHARDVADDARRELRGMEDELTAAAEALRGELTDSASAFRDAARRELAAWRANLDHLVVQADLGRMEARDEATVLRKRAERAYQAALLRLDRATQRGSDDVRTVCAGLERALRDLRDAVVELGDHTRGAA